MEKIELNKLMDLIDDIKKINSMILLHQNMDDSDFMISQYQAKKTRLVSQFIDKLVAPSTQSVQSFFIIRELIGKYYPSIKNGEIDPDKEFDQLLAAM